MPTKSSTPNTTPLGLHRKSFRLRVATLDRMHAIAARLRVSDTDAIIMAIDRLHARRSDVKEGIGSRAKAPLMKKLPRKTCSQLAQLAAAIGQTETDALERAIHDYAKALRLCG